MVAYSFRYPKPSPTYRSRKFWPQVGKKTGHGSQVLVDYSSTTQIPKVSIFNGLHDGSLVLKKFQQIFFWVHTFHIYDNIPIHFPISLPLFGQYTYPNFKKRHRFQKNHILMENSEKLVSVQSSYFDQSYWGYKNQDFSILKKWFFNSDIELSQTWTEWHNNKNVESYRMVPYSFRYPKPSPTYRSWKSTLSYLEKKIFA